MGSRLSPQGVCYGSGRRAWEYCILLGWIVPQRFREELLSFSLTLILFSYIITGILNDEFTQINLSLSCMANWFYVQRKTDYSDLNSAGNAVFEFGQLRLMAVIQDLCSPHLPPLHGDHHMDIKGYRGMS